MAVKGDTSVAIPSRLMLFRSKKPRLSLLEALNAKPVRLVNAPVEARSDGGAMLKVPLRQTRWTGWLLRMPKGATKSFELDEIGKMVWEQCDGKTSVQQIIRKLSRFCKITPAEAKPATLAFLQTLGKKGLIGFAGKEKKEE
jgi:hypothetical protein